MVKDFQVVYVNGRQRKPLFETDIPYDVKYWAETTPVPHAELEVYRHCEGDYIRLTDFLGNKPMPEDSINHPSHYTAYKGLEVIDLTEQMNFNRGNAVKYIARAGLKDSDKEVEDLKKAAWYIQREIERLRRNTND
jgi:hypothetical protein